MSVDYYYPDSMHCLNCGAGLPEEWEGTHGSKASLVWKQGIGTALEQKPGTKEKMSRAQLNQERLPAILFERFSNFCVHTAG
ncbi:MAG: hypothetical protein KC777_09920 [Cyanobacteria bacterium HKST-UBA02]|nr:hypothetical protein [Cyanobacteria bacterium HKST-UBA02]